MTKASEVTVSDAELTRIQEAAFVKTREGLRLVIAEVIAAARKEERERCAKVADMVPIETYASPPYIAQAKQVRLTVAAAIRALGDE